MTRPTLFALSLLLALPVLRAADEPAFGGKKLAEWVTMLRDDSVPRKRRAAVIALGQILSENRDREQAILPVLAKAARTDASPLVRGQAAVVLGQQRVDAAALFLPDLAEAVRAEKDSAVRRELATGLGRFGKLAKGAVLPLADAVKDPAAATRAAAADALGRVGPDARTAAPELVPLLKDADRGVRLAAVFALGRVEPDDPGPATTGMVALLDAERRRDALLSAAVGVASGLVAADPRGRDQEMANEAVLSLGLIGDRSPEVVHALAAALADSAAEVRRQAALSLGRLGPAARGAEAALSAAFKADADPLVRIYSVQTLCASHGEDRPQLIPALTDRLKADRAAEVRIAVAEELAAMGAEGQPAVPALREAQRDPQVKVREAATQALKVITRPAEKLKP